MVVLFLHPQGNLLACLIARILKGLGQQLAVCKKIIRCPNLFIERASERVCKSAITLGWRLSASMSRGIRTALNAAEGVYELKG